VISSVWGTDLYTDDSSICSCAVHAGLITAERGGVITIQIEPGASTYAGSVRNGVTSGDYGAWVGSFRFVGRGREVEQAAQLIDWASTAVSARGHNDQVYRYSCPPNGTLSGIWGTGLYTDDSSICTCAVHAGVITAERGGEVTIRIKPGATSYSGSSRNGVTSNDYGEFVGSFEFVSADASGRKPPTSTPPQKTTPPAVSTPPRNAARRPGPGAIRYLFENFVFNYPDVYQNPRNLHSILVDFKNGTVWHENQPMEEGILNVEILVCREKKRLTIRTTNTVTKFCVEYDWVFPEDGKIIAGAWKTGSGWGPSVGNLVP
jgi:hypothetical protein